VSFKINSLSALPEKEQLVETTGVSVAPFYLSAHMFFHTKSIIA